MSVPTNDQLATSPTVALREVRYRASEGFAEVLARIGGCLLVSTYQAGKLVVIGLHAGQVAVGLTNFEQAMGIAVGDDQLAVGSRGRFWFLRRTPGIGPQLEPAGRFDQCWITRSCQVTGPVDGHELAWLPNDGKGELWITNTLFSCLCTLDDQHSFVPRWRPPFVSRLAAEDRCHLNGLAAAHGQVRFVTAFGETDTAEGWRPGKATGGCLIDVPASEVVARGLCMPHSPRVHANKAWLLESGQGSLGLVDLARGAIEPVCMLPGYTRGLALVRGTAFVGLSKIRETATFGGVPIAERREELVCGVAVVDLASGRQEAAFQFLTGVDEIFDVQFLLGARFPAIVGPHAQEEDGPTVWVAPAKQNEAFG
ncbi:MAG: TIGR03032 family protein [Pirellulales bacterium]